MALKAIVDFDLCEGHMRCQSAASEVFEVRDDDKSYVLLDPIPGDLRDKVERAVRLCPRQAISIEDVT